MELNQKP
jgi:glutathione S-transferase